MAGEQHMKVLTTLSTFRGRWDGTVAELGGEYLLELGEREPYFPRFGGQTVAQMGLGSAGQVDVAFIGDSEQITWAAFYGQPQPGDEQMIDVTAVSLVAAALDVPPEAATDVLREELGVAEAQGGTHRACVTRGDVELTVTIGGGTFDLSVEPLR